MWHGRETMGIITTPRHKMSKMDSLPLRWTRVYSCVFVNLSWNTYTWPILWLLVFMPCAFLDWPGALPRFWERAAFSTMMPLIFPV